MSSRTGGRYTKPGHPPITSLEHQVKPPLFRRTPPWWSRWALGLIAVDVLITGTATGFTWNYWAQRVPKKVSGSEQSASKDDQTAAPTEMEWVLRPAWQRAGLCAGQFLFGVTFAGSLLGIRARFVRSLTILPGRPVTPGPNLSAAKIPMDGRRVFIQTADNRDNFGVELPIRKGWLEEGRDRSEIIVQFGGAKGHWFVGLHDSFINGEKLSLEDARSRFIKEWKAFGTQEDKQM